MIRSAIEYLAIEDFAQVTTGGTPSTAVPDYWDGGHIPWLNSGDLNQDIVRSASNLITELGLKNSSTRLMPKDTVLIALTGTTTGKTALLTFEACANQSVTGILPSDRHVPKYLYYYLSSIRQEILDISWGGAQKHINQNFVKKLKVPLPPLSEQKRIADILDKADSLRQKRKESIALLDELLKSVFIDMFGDPVRNEKGWEVRRLGEVLARPTQNGLYLPEELYVETGGVEIVHMADAFYGIVNRANLKRVKIDEVVTEKYSINVNDLLIARRSLNYEGAAKPCRLPDSDKSLVYESSMIRVSPNQNRILPIYLFYFLNNESARVKYVLKNVTKSTISGINQHNLNNVEILVPDINLQSEFVRIVNNVETIQSQMGESQDEMNNQFHALLQRAFRGEGGNYFHKQ